MSRLVDFYRGQATDSAGRLLSEMWEWDDGRLEDRHDFIQWMFPLAEPSRFNPDAPLLGVEDIQAFRDDEHLRANLRRSFDRMLAFFGLAQTETGEVIDGDHFAVRAPDVWEYPNHNWLRVTRILGSLRLLGLKAEARAF